MSTGFAAFLTFGYLCDSLQVYGFGGLASADSNHGKSSASVEIHNFTREHQVLNALVAGSLRTDKLHPGGDRCAQQGVAWLREHADWFAKAGRITFNNGSGVT